jgi:hypothetical protein
MTPRWHAAVAGFVSKPEQFDSMFTMSLLGGAVIAWPLATSLCCLLYTLSRRRKPVSLTVIEGGKE